MPRIVPLIVPLTVPHIVLHTVSRIVPNLRGQRVFGKLLITTDQGMVGYAVAGSGFGVHGLDHSAAPARKGERHHVRNRDTGKHKRPSDFFGIRPVGDEYRTRTRDRHAAHADKFTS